jgi:hypothetical protein
MAYMHTVLPNLTSLGLITERTRDRYLGLGMLAEEPTLLRVRERGLERELEGVVDDEEAGPHLELLAAEAHLGENGAHVGEAPPVYRRDLLRQARLLRGPGAHGHVVAGEASLVQQLHQGEESVLRRSLLSPVLLDHGSTEHQVPVLHERADELVAAGEVPVEAAPRDAELSAQRLDVELGPTFPGHQLEGPGEPLGSGEARSLLRATTPSFPLRHSCRTPVQIPYKFAWTPWIPVSSVMSAGPSRGILVVSERCWRGRGCAPGRGGRPYRAC